jgi:hypothetical protein
MTCRSLALSAKLIPKQSMLRNVRTGMTSKQPADCLCFVWLVTISVELTRREQALSVTYPRLAPTAQKPT